MKVDQRCQAQTTSRLFGEDVGDIVEVVTYNAKNIYVLFSRGVGDMFWIKSIEVIFPPKFELHAGVKKCNFGNFSERAGMVVHC